MLSLGPFFSLFFFFSFPFSPQHKHTHTLTHTHLHSFFHSPWRTFRPKVQHLASDLRRHTKSAQGYLCTLLWKQCADLPTFTRTLLPSQIARLYNAQLDKELSKIPQLNQFQAATGVPKTYLALGGGAFFIIMIFFNFAGKLLSNVLGWVYPSYRSFKALESPGHDDDKQW